MSMIIINNLLTKSAFKYIVDIDNKLKGTNNISNIPMAINITGSEVS